MLPEIQIRAHNTGILDILRHRAKWQISSSHIYSVSKTTGFFCGHHKLNPNEGECEVRWYLPPKTSHTINIRIATFGAESPGQPQNTMTKAKWRWACHEPILDLYFVSYNTDKKSLMVFEFFIPSCTLPMLSRERILRIHSTAAYWNS